jgi:hypothetical protein
MRMLDGKIPPVRSVLIYPREDGRARTTLLDAVEYLREQGVTVAVPAERRRWRGRTGWPRWRSAGST